MKDKRIVFWKILGVDRTKSNWEEVEYSSANGEHKTKEKILTKKRFERVLYLCSTDLSEEDNIYVDIALLYQEIIGAPDLFFALRDLFHEGDWSAIPEKTQVDWVRSCGYFEDETGKRLNENQFMEALYDLTPQIKTKDGIHVPASLDRDVARGMGIAELTSIRQKDFNLTEGNYALLNRFVEDCKDFTASPFIRENPSYQLWTNTKHVKCLLHITKSQIQSSLMRFRKLYMMNEPANFINAVKILCDKRKVLHPIYQYMSDFKKEFLDIKTKKITESSFLRGVLKIQGDYIPTYEDIIDVMFNTEYFHQGNDKKTIEKQKKLMDSLPNKDLRLIAFYTVIFDISLIFINACSYIEFILTHLGKLTIFPPLLELREKDKQFRINLLKKTYLLAESIWHDHNIQGKRPSFFLPKAKGKLMKKFGFPEDYFL